MDGQYGSVSFVCTQTDDVESSEIMRDHADVAKSEPGRWEKMVRLRDQIGELTQKEGELNELKDRREQETLEPLKKHLKHAKRALEACNTQALQEKSILVNVESGHFKAVRRQLKKQLAEDVEDGMDVDDDDASEREVLPAVALTTTKATSSGLVRFRVTAAVDQPTAKAIAEQKYSAAKQALKDAKAGKERATAAYENEIQLLKEWVSPQGEWGKQSAKLQNDREKLQRELKPLCARVRNEFSTTQLQEDFRLGLEDLCRPEDDEAADLRTGRGGSSSASLPSQRPLPEDYRMDVHCISANDFLKLTKIKSNSDGPASCFRTPAETGIPNLRSFVHQTTARRREQSLSSLLSASANFVDELTLCLSDRGAGVSVTSSDECEEVFEKEMKLLLDKCHGHIVSFVANLKRQVDAVLRPAMEQGSSKGQASAMQTVQSWGSKDRRTKEDRGGGGLHFSTYEATIRRDGVYTSAKAGAIDFNQELCDPVEKSFMVGWERTMNTATASGLKLCEQRLLKASHEATERVVAALTLKKLPKQHIEQASKTAERSIQTTVVETMQRVAAYANESQREINRQLLPEIQRRMNAGYEAARNVQRGQGTFGRIKDRVEGHAQVEMAAMFEEATREMLEKVYELIDALENQTTLLVTTVEKKFTEVYSGCWERTAIDPKVAQQIRAARDAVTQKIVPLRRTLEELTKSAKAS